MDKYSSILLAVKIMNEIEAWRYLILLASFGCYVAIWRLPDIIKALK